MLCQKPKKWLCGQGAPDLLLCHPLLFKSRETDRSFLLQNALQHSNTDLCHQNEVFHK